MRLLLPAALCALLAACASDLTQPQPEGQQGLLKVNPALLGQTAPKPAAAPQPEAEVQPTAEPAPASGAVVTPIPDAAPEPAAEAAEPNRASPCFSC
jgi:hypothetical protein